jgi:hypothetical protein
VAREGLSTPAISASSPAEMSRSGQCARRMPARARNVGELLEGIIASHQRHLGRHLREGGSPIRQQCRTVFLFEPTALTDAVLRRLPPKPHVRTRECGHTSLIGLRFHVGEGLSAWLLTVSRW